jgi:hypothetical protein
MFPFLEDKSNRRGLQLKLAYWCEGRR